MPFKGDERLGGPHDNEAKLNGSSDGPSVPTYGSYLRTENNVLWPYVDGGQFFVFTDAYSQTHSVSNQKASVHVKSDGIGGEFYDWSTATNVSYLPYGTQIGVGQTTYSYPINVSINNYNYQVGESLNTYVHDGNGTATTTSTYSYYSAGTYLVTTQGNPLISEYLGVSYTIGTKDVHFYTDGLGGFYGTDGDTYPYQDYTSVGYRSGSDFSVFVSELGNAYTAGTEYFEVYVYGGVATDSGAASGVNWYQAGTLIVEGQYYYWNGDGTYSYSEPV